MRLSITNVPFLFLAVLAGCSTPNDTKIEELAQQVEKQQAAIDARERDLKLRVELLEYQNYMLLGVISDSGMRDHLSANTLSLYPPEFVAVSERRYLQEKFENIYQQFRQEPGEVRHQFYDLVQPPYVTHYQFRRDWKLVSQLQAEPIADF